MEEQVYLNANTYKNLIEGLKSLELHDVVDHLQRQVARASNNFPNNSTPTTESSDFCFSTESSDDELSRKDDFHTEIQRSNEPLVINVKKASKFRNPLNKQIGLYPMTSNPRGLVLIIANNSYKLERDKRPSAKHDGANLQKLFEEMGFEVIIHYDLTGQDIKTEVKKFSELTKLRRVDSAFVIVSAHGNGKIGRQETEILGIDYTSYNYKKVFCTDIMNYFSSDQCPNLQGKPKIFIFQTCRGKNEQAVVVNHRCATDIIATPNSERQYSLSPETIRKYEDMLIVYSTIPGYVSYRDSVVGSWFIQILCEVFMNHAHNVHLQDLFYMVDYRLQFIRTTNHHCQTMSLTSQGFNKHCFLNPGFFLTSKIDESVKKEKESFKCCPDRKANVFVCSSCGSIYHEKCAEKLNFIKTYETKMICGSCEISKTFEAKCLDSIKPYNSSLEDLKKLLDKTEKENKDLKSLIYKNETLDVTDENSLDNALEILKTQSNLLKNLYKEARDKNNLLNEKVNWLEEKLNKFEKKRSVWSKKSLGKVLKRKKRLSNSIEPV